VLVPLTLTKLSEISPPSDFRAGVLLETLIALFCALELNAGETLLEPEILSFLLERIPLPNQIHLNEYPYEMLLRRFDMLVDSPLASAVCSVLFKPLTMSQVDVLKIGIRPSLYSQIHC
jgi:hypothetical protein